MVSRESLHELEVMTLEILCAAVGYRYTEKQILENVDFVMTDSTSHNLKVMESVCKELDVKAPKALTCESLTARRSDNTTHSELGPNICCVYVLIS